MVLQISVRKKNSISNTTVRFSTWTSGGSTLINLDRISAEFSSFSCQIVGWRLSPLGLPPPRRNPGSATCEQYLKQNESSFSVIYMSSWEKEKKCVYFNVNLWLFKCEIFRANAAGYSAYHGHACTIRRGVVHKQKFKDPLRLAQNGVSILSKHVEGSKVKITFDPFHMLHHS